MDDTRNTVLEDLCRIIRRTDDPGTMLERIVHMIAREMGTDACSVYVLNREKDYLVLQATVGLQPESVGKIRMSIHEGLTGLGEATGGLKTLPIEAEVLELSRFVIGADP